MACRSDALVVLLAVVLTALGMAHASVVGDAEAMREVRRGEHKLYLRTRAGGFVAVRVCDFARTAGSPLLRY